MAIASDMLVTKDGVPSPVFAKAATDEPCHNGIYKSIYKSKKKKKKFDAPQGPSPLTCWRLRMGYQVLRWLKQPQINPATMASTKTSVSLSEKKKKN